MKKRGLLILCIALAILIILLIIRETNKNQINQRLKLEELRSLPYLTYTEKKVNGSEIGIITKHNPELTFEGYNLIGPNLIDMEGNIVHLWSNPNHALGVFGVILDDGTFLTSDFRETSIAKYDWNSNLIWEKEIVNHHEIVISSNNTILIPSKEVYKYNVRNVKFDVIVELSQSGKELSKWSTYENFDYIKEFHEPLVLDNPPRFIKEYEGEVYDYYHLNSIQLLPETPIGKEDKRFQTGNLLLSFRNVNLVVILDKETKKIVWSWGPGELAGQHSPRMLNNGNILIYDNGIYRRNYTRVIELEPIKKEIVWEYKADPPESFFSEGEGYAQELPNGNILITDTSKERVFEINKIGKIVWEGFLPQINEQGGKRKLYRAIRYPKDKIDKLLELNRK